MSRQRPCTRSKGPPRALKRALPFLRELRAEARDRAALTSSPGLAASTMHRVGDRDADAHRKHAVTSTRPAAPREPNQ